MKNKLSVLLFLFCLGCQNPFTSTSIKPEAKVEIIDTEYKRHREIGLGIYNVNFKITNTGDLDIKNYKIYFELICIPNIKYERVLESEDLPKNKSISDFFIIMTKGESFKSFKIIKVEVE